jgi:hypothetical protein
MRRVTVAIKYLLELDKISRKIIHHLHAFANLPAPARIRFRIGRSDGQVHMASLSSNLVQAQHLGSLATCNFFNLNPSDVFEDRSYALLHLPYSHPLSRVFYLGWEFEMGLALL